MGLKENQRYAVRDNDDRYIMTTKDRAKALKVARQKNGRCVLETTLLYARAVCSNCLKKLPNGVDHTAHWKKKGKGYTCKKKCPTCKQKVK